MPIYHRLGQTPRKRHTQFRRPDHGLYSEHLMGSRGFSGPASLLYHIRPPTSILASRLLKRLDWQPDTDPTLRMRHFRLAELPAAHSTTLARTPALFNRDVALSFVSATTADDFHYRNAEGDEVAFVAEGSGVLESEMGELDYRAGDYVVIP